MVERVLLVLLLLLCGYTLSVLPASPGDKTNVASFRILTDEDTPVPGSRTHSSSSGAVQSNPNLTAGSSGSNGSADSRAYAELLLSVCYPHGRHLAGFEGLSPQGMVLDKSYVLVVSARPPRSQLPLPAFPAFSPCQTFHQHSRESASHKVRTYPELVHDYTQLHNSKSGLHVFRMLSPPSHACSHDDVSPWDLMGVMGVGEYLAKRYEQAWPSFHHPGNDPVDCSSLPSSHHFQSISALLHGLLNEKQFARTRVNKLKTDVVRELGSKTICPDRVDMDIAMQHSYTHEAHIFKDRDRTVNIDHRIHQTLGVEKSNSAKEIVASLRHHLCGHGGVGSDGSRDTGANNDSGVGSGGGRGNGGGHSSRGDCLWGGREKCLNMTANNVQDLWQGVSHHNQYLSTHPLFQTYSAADTYPHLQTLLAWFSSSDTHVMKVEVVDDFFFLKFLTALGHSVLRPVLPGSRLVIEQYSKAKGKGKAKFWRVLVEGEVVTESLNSCVGMTGRGVCGVDTIKHHFQQAVKRNMFVCAGHREEL